MAIEHLKNRDLKKEKEKINAYIEKTSRICEDFKKALDAIPKAYRYIKAKSLTGELPRQKAQKLKCLECSGYDRKEVKNCIMKLCPVHMFRPYQDKN